MRSTIDRAGRIVVPKALRDALGLRPGQILELEVRDGRLVVEITPTPMRLEGEGDRLAAVPLEPVPPLTAEQVRETLEQVRR
jgi:AbrB family looped-hinge helix DNA binding protein